MTRNDWQIVETPEGRFDVFKNLELLASFDNKKAALLFWDFMQWNVVPVRH